MQQIGRALCIQSRNTITNIISIGIITTFYLQTQPAPTAVVNWSYKIPNQLVSASTAANAFSHIQNFALNASVVDKKIGFSVSSNGLALTVMGTYLGSQSEFTNRVISSKYIA